MEHPALILGRLLSWLLCLVPIAKMRNLSSALVSTARARSAAAARRAAEPSHLTDDLPVCRRTKRQPSRARLPSVSVNGASPACSTPVGTPSERSAKKSRTPDRNGAAAPGGTTGGRRGRDWRTLRTLLRFLMALDSGFPTDRIGAVFCPVGSNGRGASPSLARRDAAGLAWYPAVHWWMASLPARVASRSTHGLQQRKWPDQQGGGAQLQVATKTIWTGSQVLRRVLAHSSGSVRAIRYLGRTA